MDTKTFDKYNNDTTVIKLGGRQGDYSLNEDNNIIIYFSFFHQGFKSDVTNSKKRITYKVIKQENYTGKKPLRKISNEAFYLVNADHPDFSILFKTSIDPKKRVAKLELIEFPSSGLSILSEEEKDGVVISF